MSLHMLGALAVGQFDYGKLAGSLLTAGGDVAEQVTASEEAKKTSASNQAKLTAAIVADAAAQQAKAAALTSAALAAGAPAGKMRDAAQARASADQMALDVASSAQDAAGGQVSLPLAGQRVAVANKGLAEATRKLQVKPTDLYSQNAVKAWTWVLNKIQNVQIVKAGEPVRSQEEGFFSKRIVGPVKVWHAGAGLGLLGVLWLVVKKGLLKRLFGG